MQNWPFIFKILYLARFRGLIYSGSIQARDKFPRIFIRRTRHRWLANFPFPYTFPFVSQFLIHLIPFFFFLFFHPQLFVPLIP